MSRPRPAVVTTRAGKLEGSFRDGLYIFRGIPYTAPPVKERRWMPPQPIKAWSGVRPAKQFGSVAPQIWPANGPLAAFKEVEPQAEDCLFLNIQTPGLDDARRPVMFWVHGGAFSVGSGSSVSYRKGSLAAHGDVVLVTINYRLGGLGFLRLKEVTDGDIPSTGNEGLLDQIAALEWVRENIAVFGGDPSNVTIFGESAGAMSIGCLMVMPAARGLFRRAILQSGVGSTAISLESAINFSQHLLQILGLKGSDVKSLRALSPQQLLDADMRLRTSMAGQSSEILATAMAPVIDWDIIPDVPNVLARRGGAKDMPVIIGTNLEELKLFSVMQPGIAHLDEAGLVRRLGSIASPERVPGLIDAYRKARTKRGADTGPRELLVAIQTDFHFRMPALELVEAQRDNGQRAYNYIFEWASPIMGGILGACHTLEIGFVFGNYNDKFCGTGPEADRLSRYIQDAWLAFARTGDPSSKGLGNWPVYGKNRATMILGKDCHVAEAPYEEERLAWNFLKT